MQEPRQLPQCPYQFAASHPLLKSAVAGLEGRIFFRQLTPLRPSTQHPQHTMQDSARVVPRTTAPIGPLPRPQHRFHHFPLFVGQLPTSTHRQFGDQQSISRVPPNCLLPIYETGSSCREPCWTIPPPVTSGRGSAAPMTSYSVFTIPLLYCCVATCFRRMSCGTGPNSGMPSPIS